MPREFGNSCDPFSSKRCRRTVTSGSPQLGDTGGPPAGRRRVNTAPHRQRGTVSGSTAPQPFRAGSLPKTPKSQVLARVSTRFDFSREIGAPRLLADLQPQRPIDPNIAVCTIFPLRVGPPFYDPFIDRVYTVREAVYDARMALVETVTLSKTALASKDGP